MQEIVRRMERTSSASNSHRRAAYLFALIVLIADVSGMALAQEPATDEEVGFTDPILIDSLPPLMCDEELCLRPTRMIDRGDRSSSEDPMWWLAYGPDLDWNGMDDRLQRVIRAKSPSLQRPSSVMMGERLWPLSSIMHGGHKPRNLRI